MSVVTSRGSYEHHSWQAPKLSDPSPNSTTSWYILKRFYNAKKSRNIPTWLINNKIESDFKIKANYFNSIFDSKSTPLVTGSTASNLSQYDSTTRLPHCVSMRNLYQKLLMSLTLIKHMATMIKINLDDQVMQ